jgi:hypothetical protein
LVVCQVRPISSLGGKCGAQCDVPCLKCGALFLKCSMFCHSSGIVKFFGLFYLEVLHAIQLPFLPFFLLAAWAWVLKVDPLATFIWVFFYHVCIHGSCSLCNGNFVCLRSSCPKPF